MILQNVVRYLTAQWASNLIVASLSFFLTAIIARVIGPESFGMYTIALSAGAVAAIFIDGGLRTLIMRESARPSENLAFLGPNIPNLALSHSIIISISLLTISLVVIDGVYAKLSLATICCFTMVVVTQFFSGSLRGRGEFVSDAFFLVGSRVVTFFSILFFLVVGWDSPWQIFAVWGLAGFVFIIFYNREWQIPRLSGLMRVYRAAFPFLVLELSITIYIRSDILLLDHFGIDHYDIGQFSVAFRVCEGFIMFASSIGLLVFRYLRVKIGDGASVRLEIASMVGLSLFGSILFVILVWFFSNDLVVTIFGTTYSGASENLKILSFMLLFVLPNAILNQAAIATGCEKYSMCTAILAALLNILLLVLFIPIKGVVAAAWVKVLVEGFVCVLLAVLMLRASNRNLRGSS